MSLSASMPQLDNKSLVRGYAIVSAAQMSRDARPEGGTLNS
jgi:hypothetical protein